MTTRTTILGFLSMLFLALGPYGCSGTEASCVDDCEEGQERDCTSIKGDCAAFCEATFNIEEESGCADEREAYQSCIESADDLCKNDCDGVENDFSSCLATYCLNHADTPDCKVLIASQ